MKKRLFLKFTAAYAILALLMFLVTTTLGRQLFYDRLVSDCAEKLYAEASVIAGSRASRYFQRTTTIEDLYENMLTIAASNSAVIRVIDTTGTVLVNTSTPLRKDEPDVIENFDYAAFGPRYYEISSFFGQYSRDRLTVMYPVTANMRTRGYVAISVPLDTLDEGGRSLTRLAEILTLVNFLLSLGILLFFGYTVYRPLMRITEGARAFSNGNMTHKIIVKNRDEMGYLADTMNYMAGELKKNTDYQKNFISNVSHDFRSPLTSIKGYTEAMMDGTIPVEMHDRYLGIISKETERLEKLTKSILELNTMDAGKLALNYSDFDINGMLKNTAAFFEGTCRKKKITLNLVLTGTALTVHGDKEKIEQVIYNLLDNAIKFSEKNSFIHIETTLRQKKCYVSIKDEGCGISRENLPKIWDRFYKSDSSRGRDRTGTGLGLSIVKEIITAHGQTISVVSTENVGTEFVFSLEAVL